MSTKCEIWKSVWDVYDAFIACDGCSNCFHGKCAKIKGSISDDFREPDTNLLLVLNRLWAWFCVKCRKISTSVFCTNFSQIPNIFIQY